MLNNKSDINDEHKEGSIGDSDDKDQGDHVDFVHVHVHVDNKLLILPWEGPKEHPGHVRQQGDDVDG